ncbi:MAG: amidase [Marivibrio sp.]|uniref:amidase n=1 Tax=Marivibrio sp. TaxID=2039719 RepID=UPI0032EFAFE3
MRDPLNCFIDPDLAIDGAADGPLHGLTFAVKDLFDIAGRVSCCGNPDWGRTHSPAPANAPIVDRLLAAGAVVRGKTHTDELAYSINGENPHYGTPVNPNAVGRIPGGSSSGSAAAVAGGLVDFALGTDTGGSVRVPASFCGIFGLRPTHGRIPLDGLMPLAPSFDTIGWFARDPALMRRVGEVVIDGYAADDAAPTRLYVPHDVWALCDPGAKAALSHAMAVLERTFGAPEEIGLAPVEEGLKPWFMPFRIAQGYEIHQVHQDWINRERPRFGPGVKERMAWAATLTDADYEAADAKRAEVRARFQALTEGGGLIVVPTAPGPAPEVGRTAEALESFRYRVLQNSGLAPLCGHPQISLPVGRLEGMPIGLSLIAARGRDEWLLGLAERLCGEAKSGLAEIG